MYSISRAFENTTALRKPGTNFKYIKRYDFQFFVPLGGGSRRSGSASLDAEFGLT